jgi:hypothetical protein
MTTSTHTFVGDGGTTLTIECLDEQIAFRINGLTKHTVFSVLIDTKDEETSTERQIDQIAAVLVGWRARQDAARADFRRAVRQARMVEPYERGVVRKD